MNREQIEETVLDILKEQLGYHEDINLDTKLRDDVGYDSLDMIDVCMKIEFKFSICIKDDELLSGKFNNFTAFDVVDYVEKRLNNS